MLENDMPENLRVQIYRTKTVRPISKNKKNIAISAISAISITVGWCHHVICRICLDVVVPKIDQQ